MKENNNYLFVYGTLLNESNEFAIYLKQNCNYFGKGKLKGRLYDLGEYPGAIPDENYPGYVYGSICELKNTAGALRFLDYYEGFGDDQDQPNLFIRELLGVETNGGLIDCWVYLYNLPVEDFRVIESGDYIGYKNL
ncbi:gamma-glutamylcyclotransferase [Mucilaginibacter sp. L196]|uniref:gamma-glutamylcyclotransferase family protein n=1 Tax=Mucilaginibacter sp. L196 TaxID=1641870 RepID=UPI00131CF0C9|nr:gamma-glutamylcyclotransferase family protein [Mucilaginibacter sp. L196]